MFTIEDGGQCVLFNIDCDMYTHVKVVVGLCFGSEFQGRSVVLQGITC